MPSSRYVFFKYIVVETHTTTFFYFTAGASSEWGKLRSLCPWRVTKLDFSETVEVNCFEQAVDEVTFRGFFKTYYSVLRRLYLVLRRNICQVCVIVMVVNGCVCATSGTWIILVLCFSSFDSIVD